MTGKPWEAKGAVLYSMPFVRQAFRNAGYNVSDLSSNSYQGLEQPCKEFQAKSGLTADGDAGPNTLRKLREAGAAPQLSDEAAKRLLADAIVIEGKATLVYLTTSDPELGELIRKFQQWRWANSKAGQEKKAPAVNPSSLKAAQGATVNQLFVAGGRDVAGFLPAAALFLPIVAESAAIAAAEQTLVVVGAAAAAAAAAWVATKIGARLTQVAALDAPANPLTTKGEAAWVKDSPMTGTAEKPPSWDFKDFNWKNFAKAAAALATALLAVATGLFSAVATLIAPAAAVVGIGLEIVAAAGLLLLLLLTGGKRKRGG